ncbi:hypothetical protein EJH27_01850 [Salmonella enterica subsp. enterica serovar Virchow]|nr:hypothetical protein [Salmonella enterica subsp. enterica serovar Virchow]
MSNRDCFTLLQRRTAYLCLFLQIFSILTGGISFVAMATNPPAPQGVIRNLSVQPSAAYTLSAGETTASVAKKLGITPEQLRKYNQFRSFSRPFGQLSAGDEIDIPVIRQREDNNIKNESPEEKPGAALASGVSGMAGALQSGSVSDAASSLALGAVNNGINSAVSQWLGQFGTVQAQISIDDEFSLENSSLDWLVPVYDSPSLLWYAQTGGRNKDERTTVNIGSGIRYFQGNWMYGANLFFDNDVTGHNQRLGAGLEAWTDYLQLSANSYHGLTDWHQSRDFDDYDERPADGFDVRINGWLPAYPQLGGKLVYERYRGHQVALFGNAEEDLQKDPYAVTAGISWTPFPLLTLGLDQKMGKGGLSETNANLQITWNPGESWSAQTSTEAVRQMRLISESRYDLVNRNNEIILEYKKQDLIRFNLNTDHIRDVSESVQHVEGLVSGKYELDRIDWSAGTFTAAGGKLRALDATHVELTLPAWKEPAGMAKSTKSAKEGKAGQQAQTTNTQTANRYLLTAVATDVHGNRSPARDLVVEVLPPEIAMAPLAIIRDNSPADGVSTINVSTRLTDGNGNPLAGEAVTVRVTFADNSVKTIAATSGSDGKITADIASDIPGTATVSVVSGPVHQDGVMHFAKVLADINHSTLTASPQTIPADGRTASRLTLTLKDVNNTPIADQKVAFISSLEGTRTGSVTAHPDGTYTADLTGTRVGNTSVTVMVNDASFGLEPVSVNLTAGSSNLSATQSTLAATPATIVANGTATSTVTLTLKDANGNQVSGQAVAFASSLENSTLSSVTDKGDGTYTATLKGTKSGSTSITATVDGNSFAVPAATVTLTADHATAVIDSLTIASDHQAADGRTPDRVIATVKDAYGNLVPGIRVDYAQPDGTEWSSLTQSDGTALMMYRSLIAGTFSVTVKANNSIKTVDIHFVPDVDTLGGVLEVTKDNAIADMEDTNQLVLTVKDANNNVQPGVRVVITATNGAVVNSRHATTDINGQLTVTVTSATAGESLVTVSAGLVALEETVHFVADKTTASIVTNDLTIPDNGAVANGTEKNKIKATVNDAHGKLVSGWPESFSAVDGQVSGFPVTGTDGTVTVAHTRIYSLHHLAVAQEG